jgi:hypothetical protein
MSSGVSYGEQLINDLERLSKNFPSVPVMIVLVDMPIDVDQYDKEEREEIRVAFEATRKLLEKWSMSA